MHGPSQSSAWRAICLCGVAVTPGQERSRAFLWHLDWQLGVLHSEEGAPESKAVRYSLGGNKVLFRTSLAKIEYLIVSCLVLSIDL